MVGCIFIFTDRGEEKPSPPFSEKGRKGENYYFRVLKKFQPQGDLAKMKSDWSNNVPLAMNYPPLLVGKCIYKLTYPLPLFSSFCSTTTTTTPTTHLRFIAKENFVMILKLKSILAVLGITASSVLAQSISDYLIFEPANVLSVVDNLDKPAVFQVKLKPGVLKDNQKLQVTYRGDNVNFDKCSLEFDAKNYDTFQAVTVSGTPVFGIEGSKSQSIDLQFQVFCSDGSCKYRNDKAYRIERTYTASATCKIWGDPHIIDFNGKVFDYQGAGHFLLAKTPRLIVHGIFEPLNGGKVSITKELAFNYMGTAYSVFFLDSSGKLILNKISRDETRPVKVTMDNQEKPRNIMFNLPDGTQINTYLNDQGTQFVEIKLPSYYKGQSEGLCGKFDGVSDYTNGDTCRVKEEDYLAKKTYGWPLLPPAKYASLTCPALVYPEITKPDPVKNTTNKLPPVKGTCHDVPNNYITVNIIDVSIYVENKPADIYVNPVQKPVIKRADAEAQCQKVLNVPGCQRLTDRKPFLDACITDCVAGGNLNLVEGSRTAYMAACKNAAKTYEQIGSEKTKSTCKKIQQVYGFGKKSCPKNCNNQGTCTSNGCSCTGGFTGYDCSVPPASPFQKPVVDVTTPPPPATTNPAPSQPQQPVQSERMMRFFQWLITNYPQYLPLIQRLLANQ